MLLIKYIILGIIQGFTEPLPISSSGHLIIFKTLFNDKVLNDINFEIIVNFGSLIAVIILYKNEILNIIKDFFLYLKTKNNKYKINYKYTFNIIIGTIPACIIGFVFKEKIDNLSTIKVVGFSLIITSILLYLVKNKKGNKDKKDITYIDSFKIGLFQSIALIPGISRSGATIVGALSSNLNKETSVNYSFMLYIPISIASLILGVFDLLKSSNLSDLIIPYFVSLVFASFTTYFSSKLFINIIKKEKLIYFSIYCIIVGLLVILLN